MAHFVLALRFRDLQRQANKFGSSQTVVSLIGACQSKAVPCHCLDGTIAFVQMHGRLSVVYITTQTSLKMTMKSHKKS